MNAVVLLPLKSFATAKQRLRSELDDETTTALVERLARGVLDACHPLPVWVITSDTDIANWAGGLGQTVFTPDREGLNEGITEAFHAAQDFAYVVVVHGDLAHPVGLGLLDEQPGVRLFTDHHGTGSNVLVVPTSADFTFHYGPGSAQRHITIAQTLDMPIEVIRNSPWAYDIDEPADLVGG